MLSAACGGWLGGMLCGSLFLGVLNRESMNVGMSCRQIVKYEQIHPE